MCLVAREVGELQESLSGMFEVQNDRREEPDAQ